MYIILFGELSSSKRGKYRQHYTREYFGVCYSSQRVTLVWEGQMDMVGPGKTQMKLTGHRLPQRASKTRVDPISSPQRSSSGDAAHALNTPEDNALFFFFACFGPVARRWLRC